MAKLKKWGIAAYWVMAVLYWEVLTHWGMYGRFHAAFRFALGFGLALGLGLAALTALLPRRLRLPVALVLSGVLALLYGSQMVYCFIFGTPYSLSQVGLGADALGQFWRELLSTMADRLPWVLGLLVPVAALGLLAWLGALPFPRRRGAAVMALLASASALLTWAAIRSGGTAMYSDHYFFTSTRTTTTQTMERFGVPMTFVLELARPEEQSLLAAPAQEPAPQAAVPEQTQPEEEPVRYNVLEIDFDDLSQATEDEALQALNAYCAALEPTNQNAYTGLLKDYNLILICAESFSPAALDPEVTPTLYKLANEGFVFKNFFNTFPNTTIDGEYTLLQGLYPDSGRDKNHSSMLASAENSLPFALGNIFAQQRQVKSWGYHNNIRSYYSRHISHPNMGYEMQFNHSGMELEGYWPTSDFEMMEQSVDDYIGQEQFNVYYMTFSGHYQYKTSLNAIARDNFNQVKDLPDYDHAQKAYLACHIELDKAMAYLLRRLEEAGVADRTAIVMTGDHFPYGLQKWEYFGMIGKEEDYFETYRSTLVFWVGGMEEPVEVEQYCCNADILPTILNLWGFEYDSRLLAGTDVFSDGLHTAVLIDRSFLTDQVWFDANTGEVRYQVPQEQVPQDYVERMNQQIAARFEFSSEVLRTDYYGFLFGEQESSTE